MEQVFSVMRSNIARVQDVIAASVAGISTMRRRE